MGEFRNPILDGCHPDPSICAADGAFYLVTSTFEYLPGLPIHRSTNLVDWELVGHGIHRPDQLDYTGVSSSRGLFAPTLRHHAGRFYLVCTMMPDEGSDVPRNGHFIVTADDAAGPWSDPVWIDGIGGIDPSLTFDEGRVWLCGTRLSDPERLPGQTEVWLTELDPTTLQPIGEQHVLWHGALRDAVWAEGPHLYRRPDGTWLLLAAEGGTEDDHAICVAYASRIEGPYRGDRGNPRLTHRDLGPHHPIRAVGHADLVDDTEGHTWAVMLASRVVAERPSLCGRQTNLVPVAWDGMRPLFAPGTGRVTATVDAPGVPAPAPRPTRVIDTFESTTLDGAWTSPRWLPSAFAKPQHPGIRLHATAEEPDTVGHTAFLARRLPTDETTLQVTGRLRPDAGALRAGILLRVSEHAYAEVSLDMSGDIRLRVAGRDGVSTQVCGTVDATLSHVITLSLTEGLLVASVDDTSGEPMDAAPLRDGLDGSFLGAWIGPVAVGTGAFDIEQIDLRWREPA